jgi:signal transduction histidine kinase
VSLTPAVTPAGQPALSRWGHAWRIAVSAVGGVVLLVVTLGQLGPDAPPWVTPLVLADVVLLGPLALVLLAFHRRYPLPVALAVTALTAVSSLAAVAGLVCLVSIAARRRGREIGAVVALAVVSGFGYELVYPTSSSGPSLWVTLNFVLLVLGIVVGWGLYLGARRELVESWRLRAEGADRERALVDTQARAAERTRIAREMHDVLAHRLSLLSMHAGALAFREDLPAAQVRAEAQVLQRTAKESLDELRGVLGLLREDDSGVPPQPALDDLGALVEQARAAGPVTLRTGLDGASPPTWLGRQVYRVVQEGLTNARKHAPGAPVDVRLDGTPGSALVVEIRNSPGRAAAAAGTSGTAGAGLGLVGVAERAALAGGSMTHGPTPDGGYRVVVTFPWVPGAGHA